MSYVNQDPDITPTIVVPFKGKHPVAVTARSWMEDMDYHQADAACWCGDSPGCCVDCKEDSVNMMMGKLNIGSGEDADMFR